MEKERSSTLAAGLLIAILMKSWIMIMKKPPRVDLGGFLFSIKNQRPA